MKIQQLQQTLEQAQQQEMQFKMQLEVSNNYLLIIYICVVGAVFIDRLDRQS
jgi:hypothetical protein